MMKPFILAVLLLFSTSAWAQQKSVDSAHIDLTREEREQLVNDASVLREVMDDERPGFTHEVVGLVQADVEEVFKVVTTFDEYPEFMPSVDKVEILQRTDDHAIVNYTLKLPLEIVRKYRLRTVFSRDSSRATLSWDMIEWPGLDPDESFRDTDGFWVIEMDPQVAGQSIVLFRTYTDPGEIPQGLEWIFEILLDQNMPDMVSRVLRRAAGAPR